VLANNKGLEDLDSQETLLQYGFELDDFRKNNSRPKI
jgi:hypothetical protein